MLTKIEIDGFKTFYNFELELGPLQVIVGPNGAGKSNLFDALRLLARLAETDIRTAFTSLRGGPLEQFTQYANGERADRIRFAVELFVDQTVRDSWGAEATLEHTRLRYEITIRRDIDPRGLPRFFVAREKLATIPQQNDPWLTRHHLCPNNWLTPNDSPEQIFIETLTSVKEDTVILGSFAKDDNALTPKNSERSFLSGFNSADQPHQFAMRQELRAWQILHLEPEMLRQPSRVGVRDVLDANGQNLPAVLARMQAEDPFFINDVSRDLANLIPGLIRVALGTDQARNHYDLWVYTDKGQRFPAELLSDGTLRALALVTLKNDPEHRGLLGIEEPENGIHPLGLQTLVNTLRELATDFDNPDHRDFPLRQLLINAHSPTLAAQEEIWPHLLFALPTTLVNPESQVDTSLQITRIRPVHHPSRHREAVDYHILKELEHYLKPANVTDIIAKLRENGKNSQ